MAHMKGNAARPERVVMEEVPGALKLHSDGSIVRIDKDLIINIPPSEQPREEDYGVASKDVVIQKKEREIGCELWVRIYLPPPRPTRFPVLLYFHGGGFCFLSPAYMVSHRCCLKWAAAIGAIVISVKYRLAPEHRLPAAYEDFVAAVEWVRSHRDAVEATDPWLKSHADLSNVFLIGDSAGGNIVHHLVMRKGLEGLRGAILLQPFFGGEERTQSEIESPEDNLVSVNLCDTLWRLALPVGVSKDHPFSNPAMLIDSSGVPNVVFPPMLVVLAGKDCLRDRGFEYCQAMKKCGKKIQFIEFDEEGHGFHHRFEEDCKNSKRLIELVAFFVSSNCNPGGLIINDVDFSLCKDFE